MGWLGWRGAEVKQMYDAAARTALQTVGKEIIEAAKKDVPELAGDLKDSGKATKSRSKVPSTLLSFGGKGVPYAVRWHENPEGVQFKRGRKKRFLADPFNRLAERRVRQEYLAEIVRRRAG